MKNEYRGQKRHKKTSGRAVFGLAIGGAVLALAVLTSFVLFNWINGNPDTSTVAGGPDSTPSGSASAAVPSVPSQPEPEPEPQPVEHTLRYSAVGDNLIHSAVYASAATHAGGDGYDFSFCYEHVRGFFQDYDVNWINQETLISNLPAATYPCFSTPVELGHATYDAGWRVFALSNNHTYDMGANGIAKTREFWASMPQDTVNYGLFTGTQDDSGIAVQEVNGFTIAYVAFTEHTNGINTPAGTEAFVIYTSERDAMEYKVRRAREMADVVIVSVHWGVENSHTVTQAQRDLGASFGNWGADIVLGTHPHVVQDLEWLKAEDGRDVLVAYSLGNFLSAQSQPNQLIGLALTFNLSQTVDPDGTRHPLKIDDAKVYPTVTQYEYHGGQYYENPRTYMYRDYTDELAAQHYVKGSKTNAWSRQYIQDVLTQNVSAEFLVLD